MRIFYTPVISETRGIVATDSRVVSATPFVASSSLPPYSRASMTVMLATGAADGEDLAEDTIDN